MKGRDHSKDLGVDEDN